MIKLLFFSAFASLSQVADDPDTLRTELSPSIAGIASSAVDDGWLTIRTTAYTHTESDHIKYGRSTAAGTTLKFGEERSAAADWSRFPLGTRFQIEGESAIYVVEDYGSALVGKSTIDLYRPTRSSMNKWGARNVRIKILKWGSFKKSLGMMTPRTRHQSVRKMVNQIKAKNSALRKVVELL